MERTAVEIRVLGSLVEKQLTTPDQYPLTSKALLAACNQRSNREPVVDLSERDVDDAMLELRPDGLARTVTGGRAHRHRHVLDEALGLDQRALALLSVLMLRGPQTVGELRIRTERMADFIDLDEVESTLEVLAARDDGLVRRLERRPGQKEPRWAHLLGGEPVEPDAQGTGATGSPGAGGTVVATRRSELEAVRSEVERLTMLVEHLYALLDEPLVEVSTPDEGDEAE